MDDFEPAYDDADVYDDAPAQSSIATPLIRALLAAFVAFGIYALLFGDIGGDDDLAVIATEGTEQTTLPAPAATPTTNPSTVPIQPGPSGSPTATASEGPAGGQVGAGVSVQVIAGADTTADQFADAVAAMQEMGYEVTESGVSPNAYPQTTIFATAGEEAQAQALNQADPRFTTVGENPGTLTAEIQIHVLVGEDWPIGETAAPTDTATAAATEG